MPRHVPPTVSQVLIALRRARGLTQAELSQAAGITEDVLAQYETGDRAPSPDRLDLLLGALRVSREVFDFLLAGLEKTVDPDSLEPLSLVASVDPTADERRVIQAIALRTGGATVELVERTLTRIARRERTQEAREAAERLCRELLSCDPADRSFLVEASPEYQSWALVERLCDESERAAADCADRALELARLALKVARHVRDKPFRRPLLGYAGFFLGNSRRVGGDLNGAEKAFRKAWKLWRLGGGGEDVLAEWRLFDLEASFFRDRRRWKEALERHADALSIAPEEAQGLILLNKAATFEQMGKAEKALAMLDQADPLLSRQGNPRLWFGMQFNRTVNLCHLDRYEAAEVLLPEVRKLAFELDNDLDLVRVVWLSGRTAAGLGRMEEALAALEQVRSEFRVREIAYDFALVSLELAIFRLARGESGLVKTLAQELWWIFRAQGVHREALAALEVFRQGVDRETASVDLARRILAYLRLAQHDDALRFQG